MNLGDVVISADLPNVTLSPSQLPIYHRPIELALLHRDERTGAEHYVIRYPEGLRSLPHRHSAAHTIVVLEGALEANGALRRAPGRCLVAASAMI